MTADRLYRALTWCGKPIPPARMAKAEALADSPEVWAEVRERLVPYLAYTPPDPPIPPDPAPDA